MEEVPLEEVQPLTLEELESIRQEAYNEGFAVGEKEGFHSTTLKVRQEAEVALTAKIAASGATDGATCSSPSPSRTPRSKSPWSTSCSTSPDR